MHPTDIRRAVLWSRPAAWSRALEMIEGMAPHFQGGNDEFDINIANDSMEKGGGTKPGSKREYHDKKFGKQRHDKKNSAESSGDMRDFNRGGKTFGKGGKGSTAKGGRGKGGRGAGGGKGTSGKGGGGKGGRGAGGPGKTIQKKRPGKDARKARK